MNGKGAEREKEAKTYEEKKKQKERRRTKAAGPENEIKLHFFPKIPTSSVFRNNREPRKQTTLKSWEPDFSRWTIALIHTLKV